MTLSVTDVTRYLRAAVPFTYVANEFGPTSWADCAYVRINGGFPPSEWTSKRKPSVQVVLRHSDPAKAESLANGIYEYLHRRTEFAFGDTRIVNCKADQSAPLYLGRDDNQRSLYSLNFTITTI